MKTLTFIFIEPGHASKATVTAETEIECKEKYFLKYPERLDHKGLTIYPGDGDDIVFGLVPIK